MEDELPPIPPNCPYFEKYNDEMGWRFNFSANEFVFLSCCCQRPIIAAVAEVAWRIEGRRLSATLPLLDGYGTIWKDKANCDIRRAVDEADDNASAWRRWGTVK